MIILCFIMEGNFFVEYTYGKYHVFTFFVCKRKILLSILMPSVSYVHFNQLVDYCAKHAYTS